jgi:hypothetical protein
MDSGRLGQRWLLACAAAALLANYFGGFSLVVTGVFVAICLIGAALIGSGEDPVGMGFPADDWAVDAVTAGGFTAPVDVVAAPDEVAAEYAEPYPVEDAEPYPGEDESDESAVLDVTAETEPSPA